MLTVTLLRHAKSSWDDPTLDDFERPLAPRGEAAAPLMGRVLAREKIAPDVILCSPAVRTRQTLALARTNWPLGGAPVESPRDLYLASGADLLAKLRQLPETVRHAMLVGHNPGLHALALDLIGDGVRASISALAHKLPTGGLVVIDFSGTKDWREIRVAEGTLRIFTTPRLES